MITKMSKYTFILLSSELNDFLAQLQQLGVVDITRSTVETDAVSKDMMSLYKRYNQIISKLETFKAENKEIEAAEPGLTAGKELVICAEESFQRIAEIKSLLTQLDRDAKEAAPWGDFSDEDLTKIDSLGFVPHFYSINENKFLPEWENKYPLHIINRTNGKVYFVILAEKSEQFKFKAVETKFPERSISVINAQIEQLSMELKQLQGKVMGIAQKSDYLREDSQQLFSELDLYFAQTASKKEGEGTISILEGFAKTEDDDTLKEYFDKSDVLYLREAAKGEDNPPIKLKSNWFNKLFHPIGGLYMLPTYDELDLTPYFAPFYMLFFGLCLGDMGYGLIMVILGLIVAFAAPKFSGYGKLVVWLGVGSIIMPLLSGTFFGLKLPEIIPSMPENIKGLFFSDIKMFWFSIIFGLFQIVFARLLRATFAFSRKRWDEGLTEVGWSMLIVWAAFAYAGGQMDTTFLPDIVNKILAICGLVLVLFCSSPSKNFLLRPLKGIVSLYDITGIFGDMLSYIRLFGLGTTGGILAFVINSIGMNFSSIPYVGWVLTVVFLIFGHLAVMGLSCLGAFVHPVRLTFVEFYKNAGFIGGGREFNPLRKRI